MHWMKNKVKGGNTCGNHTCSSFICSFTNTVFALLLSQINGRHILTHQTCLQIVLIDLNYHQLIEYIFGTFCKSFVQCRLANQIFNYSRFLQRSSQRHCKVSWHYAHCYCTISWFPGFFEFHITNWHMATQYWTTVTLRYLKCLQ